MPDGSLCSTFAYGLKGKAGSETKEGPSKGPARSSIKRRHRKGPLDQVGTPHPSLRPSAENSSSLAAAGRVITGEAVPCCRGERGGIRWRNEGGGSAEHT